MPELPIPESLPKREPVRNPGYNLVRTLQEGTSDFKLILNINNAGTVPETTAAKGETDGTLRVAFILSDGTNLVNWKSETSGEAKVVLHGKDKDSTVAAFKVDTNNIQMVRPFEEIIQLDNVLIPSSEGVLLDASASLNSGGVYEVTFTIVNIDGTNNVSVSVGVDVGAGGSLSGAEYLLRTVTLPAGGFNGPHTITLPGTDDIRGIAGAADDAAIVFNKIRRVDATV